MNYPLITKLMIKGRLSYWCQRARVDQDPILFPWYGPKIMFLRFFSLSGGVLTDVPYMAGTVAEKTASWIHAGKRSFYYTEHPFWLLFPDDQCHPLYELMLGATERASMNLYYCFELLHTLVYWALFHVWDITSFV